MNDATPSEDSKSNQTDTTQTSVTASSVTDAVGRSVDGHRVLLVDDQPMIGEAVRRLLADQADITFAFCKDAAKALSTRNDDPQGASRPFDKDRDGFVIGEPKQLSNSATHSTQAVKNFVIHLGREFPGIQTECIDERYTSKIAQRSMIESGLSKKKRSDKKLIDEISATLILQDYLIQKENGFR